MSDLWAITSFFNPSGFQRKLKNYREFRKRLAVPLVAVEHSTEGRFELRPDDADVLVQVRGGSVMWQKERLLNVALAHLPSGCDYVAWLDCDVIFARRDWPAAAMRECDRGVMCQLYKTVHHQRPDVPPDSIGVDAAYLAHVSIGYAISIGIKCSVASVMQPCERAYKRGHAWCARRDLLAKHGFYDRGIVGGGVSLMSSAATRQTEEQIAHLGFPPGLAADYRTWATEFQLDFGQPGFVEGDLFHLWHGDLRDRSYTERHRILAQQEFDPATDIALDESGSWRWHSAKPELHETVRRYFADRREDGP